VVPTGIGKAGFVDELEDIPQEVLREALDALATRAARAPRTSPATKGETR
jgi:3-dehydroquinate synthase